MLFKRNGRTQKNGNDLIHTRLIEAHTIAFDNIYGLDIVKNKNGVHGSIKSNVDI